MRNIDLDEVTGEELPQLARREFRRLKQWQAATGDVSAYIASLSPAAWFRYGRGITSAGGLVSQWNDQSGNARHYKQATGTNQPTLEADGSISGDGLNNYLQTDAFTLNVPYSVCILAKALSWTNGDRFYDGVVNGSFTLQQATASPQIRMADSVLGTATTSLLAVGDYGVIVSTQNAVPVGLIQINNNAPITAAMSGIGMGGLTLFASGAAASFGNVQVKEEIVFPYALDAATISAVVAYLATVGGLSV